MYEIMIVDDHTHLVDSLAIGLPWDDMGISAVHKAYSAEEALELLQYRQVDILVTDIQMQGMTGLELVSEVNAKWSNIRSVILTGYDEFQYAKQALRQGVFDYLLKPVANEELERTLRKLIADIQAHGERMVGEQKLFRLFKEGLPKLREGLLRDLLVGTRIPRTVVEEKTRLYELPFPWGYPIALISLRLEEKDESRDVYASSLMEYAVANIADEVLAGEFAVWHGKDRHDYLIFLVRPLPAASEEKEPRDAVEHHVRMIQQHINRFLKIKVSAVLSDWGEFPAALPALHQSTIAAYTDVIGDQTDSFLYAVQETYLQEIRPLTELYAPPTLLQLIEIEQWNAFEQKLNRIFEELDSHGIKSREYVYETYASLLQAYSYFVHKKGRCLPEVFGQNAKMSMRMEAGWSVAALRDWSYRRLSELKAYSDKQSDHFRSNLMEQIYEFVRHHLKDVTLQSVADHVHLHPVYVSNLFKSESGENFSGYVLRQRMESALYLLKTKDMKINQIALEIGYQKPQYFIKLFKTHFGITPHEYKNSM
ncbi:response regulator [Cohnella pontilimi]|uniref:Response regulator n=1 Tax=Cohnella pontilimi TaxID=2564100 RepID=A0A4U0FD11_9BACL|nr:response regulator [Cohnella pontilimi]TJY42793.1 response regulator [Cohnella pontilimi]